MKTNFESNIRSIYNRFIYDMIPAKSAEVSFYLLLSFFPILIFTITLISYIPIIHLNRYVNELSKVMPSNAYTIVSYIIDKAISDKSIKLLVVSFFITLWSSTNGVKALIKGINRAYDQRETRPFIKVVAISLIFTIEIVILIIFSMVLIVYGVRIGIFIFHFFGLSEMFLNMWGWIRYGIALITMILIFISLYKYTPNHNIRTRDALPGAVAATLGWVSASLVFSYYANNYVNYNLLYGSIGGMIALLSWIYLSSLVILIGAEINAAIYFRIRGKSKAKPIQY